MDFLPGASLFSLSCPGTVQLRAHAKPFQSFKGRTGVRSSTTPITYCVILGSRCRLLLNHSQDPPRERRHDPSGKLPRLPVPAKLTLQVRSGAEWVIDREVCVDIGL